MEKNSVDRPVVEVASAYKSFGDRIAVDGIDLKIPPGMCFGLLGPNGAGKTTTLRMIYGVTRPTRGVIRVFDMEVGSNLRAVRSRIGVALQQNALIEALSPRANLHVFGRYHLLRPPELFKRAEELIDFLELRSHVDVPVRHLSGGFQRRLAIAMSLINRPDLLILDEPTTGLDPAVRLALWSRIRDLRRHGMTVLLTTHYMDEAQRLCDRVAIISSGKVMSEGAPGKLIASLADETVEFDCTAAEQAALLDGFVPSVRSLRVGRRLMVYLEDTARLVEHIHRYDQGERRAVVVRPTNLEDVFLAVTGTSLERSQ